MKANGELLGAVMSRLEKKDAPEEESYSPGASDAAAEVLAAIRAGDAEQLAAAMKALIRMCNAEE